MPQILLTLGVLAFVLLIIGIIVVSAIYSSRKEKERTRQLQSTAAQIGWSFAEQAPLNMIPGSDRFEILTQGHTRNITNMMYGEASGIKSAVFDYTYVTGHGKHRQTHSQSVVYLERADLNVPNFSLRPEGFFHKLITAFGYQDIDFGQRPEFSRRYILRGADEPAIRRTFGDGLLSFFESYEGTSADGGGNQLLVFRGGVRLEPQEIQPYVGVGLSILNLFPRY